MKNFKKIILLIAILAAVAAAPTLRENTAEGGTLTVKKYSILEAVSEDGAAPALEAIKQNITDRAPELYNSIRYRSGREEGNVYKIKEINGDHISGEAINNITADNSGVYLNRQDLKQFYDISILTHGDIIEVFYNETGDITSLEIIGGEWE